MREREEQVFRAGSTKTARYALRRPLRGVAKPIPIYNVDEHGKGHSFATLELIEPQGSFLDLRTRGWPIDRNQYNGWWDGLPYPVYEMRPQGFLGRNFAQRIYRDLQVSSDPENWSDDDIVYALSRYGYDGTGNLIVGERAYELWLSFVARPVDPLPEAGLSERYLDLADNVTSRVGSGSSAAGEFPKFTVSRNLPGSASPHAIVKFSGADNSTAVVRWSDLLVCEHLALVALAEVTELESARSRILKTDHGRTFLDVERFDRNLMFGRSEAVSLSCLNAALLGSSASAWPDLVKELAQRKLVDDGILEKVKTLWWYGRLIANTDMHLGNLSFCFTPQPNQVPRLRLAPTYDMLPMLYAPLSGGEVPARTFEPALPLPEDRAAWMMACKAAILFWKTSSQDSRISESFRAVCKENHEGLIGMMEKV